GRGKAEALARRVVETGADVVVLDGELSPGQYSSLTALLPDGTVVVDRHRLVLGIFESGAGDEAARLQVELARLRYELPRIRETEERTHMQRAAETGSRVVDTERRIRTVENKLDELADRAGERRAERREQGFDLVAVAGYTNAGKSTLLHRLADDLSIEGISPEHDDLDGEAAVEDRLFETLDTTTRRATIGGRRVLLTDTVGLVDGIPHDLVASFSATLDAVADSDAALLIADASDSLSAMREKLRVSLGELDDPRGELLIVLNKVDLLDDAAVERRRRAAESVAGDRATAVLAVSATEGTGIDRLRETVAGTLPTEEVRFDLPNTGETQSFLAWAHEHGRADAEYEGDRVRVR
ncbi:GTPase, partial [Halolamina salina]|uniref:GTPase n=1 Tax=Halolamina salina TaxID=1220023 RepID=UPI00360C069E